MKLHTDYSERVAIATDPTPWVDSPSPGVMRKMLERDGEELARATTLVAYAPDTAFPRHDHELGEETFVLSGTFADEHGVYNAGTYLRNPPGSSHAPYSKSGCTLFVKLRYLAPDDQTRIVVDTVKSEWYPGRVHGLSVLPLAAHGHESTALVRWQPGTRFSRHAHWGGEEIFVIDGVFYDEHGRYPSGSWLRSPHMSVHTPYSTEGCTIFVKTGHLSALSLDASVIAA